MRKNEGACRHEYARVVQEYHFMILTKLPYSSKLMGGEQTFTEKKHDVDDDDE